MLVRPFPVELCEFAELLGRPTTETSSGPSIVRFPADPLDEASTSLPCTEKSKKFAGNGIAFHFFRFRYFRCRDRTVEILINVLSSYGRQFHPYFQLFLAGLVLVYRTSSITFPGQTPILSFCTDKLPGILDM